MTTQNIVISPNTVGEWADTLLCALTKEEIEALIEHLLAYLGKEV